jgi:hypothetical protein
MPFIWVRGLTLTLCEGGDFMTDYKLTVEVLEARIEPVNMTLGGQ